MAHTKFFAVDATEATFLFIFIGEIDSAAKHTQCIDYNVVQVIAKKKIRPNERGIARIKTERKRRAAR